MPTYSDWIQGEDVERSKSSFEDADFRWRRTDPGTSYPTGARDEGAVTDAINAELNLLATANLTLGNSSLITEYGSISSVIAHMDWGTSDAFRVEASRDDAGIYVSAASLQSSLAASYLASLTPPAGAASGELESSTFTPVAVVVTLPMTEYGGAGAQLAISTFTRPAADRFDDSGSPSLVDSYITVNPTGGAAPRTVTFTSDFNPGDGGFIIWPETQYSASPPWSVDWPPAFGKDFSVERRYEINPDVAPTFAFTFRPPRHRWVYPDQPTIFGIPPLRQVQRGDGLGFSSAPRAIQNNSAQGSLRNFGFN